MKVALLFTVVLCAIAYVSADTPVEQCQQDRAAGELKQSITIGRCKKTPCRLKKKRTINTEFRFTPDREVKTLTNTVNAIIVGIPFPFIGVDGTDACTQLFESDATTKTKCPLKAGTEYVYKNSFDVLEIYPVLQTVVQWELTADDGKDVVCFRVKAKITN